MNAEIKRPIDIQNDQALHNTWAKHLDEFAQIPKDHPTGLNEINQLTAEIFLTDPQLRSWLPNLDGNEAAAEIIEKAIRSHSFPGADSVSPQEYNGLLQAVHVKEQLARNYILWHIAEGKTFGLETWELEVLKTSCQVAGEFDAMCFEWREKVPYNPLNRKAEEKGLTNQYAIIEEGEGGLEETPYAVALDNVYPILEKFGDLADILESFHGDNADAASWAAYLRAYTRALGSAENEKLADLWRTVDEVWLRVSGRLQPIASREYDYYDPNGIRVFPDFRLVLNMEEPELAESVRATKDAMIQYLPGILSESDAFQASKGAMQNVQLFTAGSDIVFAGSLDFQPSGQFLPNEDKVKREHGIKVFLNPGATRGRWKLAIQLVEKVFPEYVERFKSVDASLDLIAIHLAGHEVGEPLLDTDSVRQKIGSTVFRLLNEDAATLTTTIVLVDRVKNGEFDEEILARQALVLLGTYLRYIEVGRGTKHMEPYYQGMGLLGLRRMVEADFLYFEDNQTKINFGAVEKLFELSVRDLKKQAEIADSDNPKLALDYLHPIQDAELDPAIAFLIQKIHPEIPARAIELAI